MSEKKNISVAQEKRIAYLLGGKVPANSGGTKFGGGDVLTDKFLIEAKTPAAPKASFSIKKDWLCKAREQMFEQGKDHYALAFQFEPHGNNYFVINETLFLELLTRLEEEK